VRRGAGPAALLLTLLPGLARPVAGGGFAFRPISLLPERDASAAPGRPAFGPLLDRKTVLVTGGLLLGVPVAGWLLWWSGHKTTSFHLASEGWFGRNTYAGGADKASHFAFDYILEQSAESLFLRMGHSPSDSRILAVAGASLGGLIGEVGDGFKFGGASWEDAASNVLGALAGALVSAEGWGDTTGFRVGWVPTSIRGGSALGASEHYSQEIYTLDLKLAGAAPRLGLRPGLARFLIVSATYGVKGYRYAPKEQRQRNVGIELGLNLPEILTALGAPPDRGLWKYVHGILTYFRVPFTAIGYRYDMNSHRWHGPDSGQAYTFTTAGEP
jgi:hypothetical protein